MKISQFYPQDQLQQCSVKMGDPGCMLHSEGMSPIIANMYIEHFKEKVLRTEKKPLGYQEGMWTIPS